MIKFFNRAKYLSTPALIIIISVMLLSGCGVYFDSPSAAPSAPVAEEWQKCFGGSLSDEAYSMQLTGDGGFLMAGVTHSNDEDVSGNHGNGDCWVTKLTAPKSSRQPDIQWQKCLGGTFYDQAYSIQPTADGGYIMTGYTNSNDGDVSGNHGQADYWVVKLDAAGSIEWQKCLGGTSYEEGLSVQQTSDGGYIVAGYTQSNDGDVSGNHGGIDYWVVKLDASGNITWQKCYGGTNTDTAYSIQETADGGYIIVGTTLSNDGQVSGNHGSQDFWVVKTDADGDLVWQKCYGGSLVELALSVQQAADEGYIIAGWSSSSNGDVGGNHGDFDYWVVKTDGTGNLEWENNFGGSAFDDCRFVEQTADGGYIIAGRTDSSDGDVTGYRGASDYWLVKTDANLNLVWEKCLGGTNEDYAYAVRQTPDGLYVIGGVTGSDDIDVSGNHGGRDFWLIKMNEPE